MQTADVLKDNLAGLGWYIRRTPDSAALAEWYGGIKHSSDNAWDTVKQGFADAYRTLSESLAEAWGEL